MTKLFIENANREASASIRIYPLDEHSQVIAPDSFTSMDDLGLSFGIALQPAPVLCVGSSTFAGAFVLDGVPGQYSVTPDGKPPIPLNDVIGVIGALQDEGYRVDILTAWSPGSNT